MDYNFLSEEDELRVNEYLLHKQELVYHYSANDPEQRKITWDI